MLYQLSYARKARIVAAPGRQLRPAALLRRHRDGFERSRLGTDSGMDETNDPTPPEPVPSPDPPTPTDPGPAPPELTPEAGTPERQQDPGGHGYGGVQQEKDGDEEEAPREHPLEDPDTDARQEESDG